MTHYNLLKLQQSQHQCTFCVSCCEALLFCWVSSRPAGILMQTCQTVQSRQEESNYGFSIHQLCREGIFPLLHQVSHECVSSGSCRYPLPELWWTLALKLPSWSASFAKLALASPSPLLQICLLFSWPMVNNFHAQVMSQLLCACLATQENFMRWLLTWLICLVTSHSWRCLDETA